MPLPGQTGTSASRTPCPHLGMIETRLRAGVIDPERAPGPSGATFRGRDTPGTRCGAGRRSSSWGGPTRFSWAEPIGDRLLGAIWGLYPVTVWRLALHAKGYPAVRGAPATR